MNLEIDRVTKRYQGGVVALDGVTLELPAATYTCVMGASGSGKSTLLRVIAGLESCDAGSIRLGGQSLDGQPPERRPVHTVFQSYALFPHMSVAENVGFAARIRGERGARLEGRVAGLLADVGLGEPGLAERRPDALSGGQAQRVALARALAGSPQLLLLDEPLAALDRPLRAGLRRMLGATQRARGLSFVHVTHDPEEAMALADQLVLLAAGQVIGVGEPHQLYTQPPSQTAARLLGELSQLPVDGTPRFIRPEKLVVQTGLERASDHQGEREDALRRVGAVFAFEHSLGDRWEIEVEVAGEPLIVRRAGRLDAEPGASVTLCWSARDEISFD